VNIHFSARDSELPYFRQCPALGGFLQWFKRARETRSSCALEGVNIKDAFVHVAPSSPIPCAILPPSHSIAGCW
jgi:hypothetical protein